MGTVTLRSPKGKDVDRALNKSFDMEHGKPNMVLFISTITPMIITNHPVGNVKNEHFVDDLEYGDFMKLKTAVTTFIGELNPVKKGE